MQHFSRSYFESASTAYLETYYQEKINTEQKTKLESKPCIVPQSFNLTYAYRLNFTIRVKKLTSEIQIIQNIKVYLLKFHKKSEQNHSWCLKSFSFQLLKSIHLKFVYRLKQIMMEFKKFPKKTLIND